MLHHHYVRQIAAKALIIALSQIVFLHKVGRRTFEEHGVAVLIHPARIFHLVQLLFQIRCAFHHLRGLLRPLVIAHSLNKNDVINKTMRVLIFVIYKRVIHSCIFTNAQYQLLLSGIHNLSINSNQHLAQQLDEARDRRDVKFLACGVRMAQCRSDRDYVHAVSLSRYDAAFQSGVHRIDSRLCAE